MSISGAQLRMARVALRWPIKDLARKAGVATATITRLEAGLPSHRLTRQALRKALERAGIVFVRRRDGDGILLTHATECVFDLIDIARGAGARSGFDVAVRERIDRFLQSSATWQREWRLSGRSHYVRELIKQLRSEAGRSDSGNAEILRLAMRHIHAASSGNSMHAKYSNRTRHITRS